jgi:hypothetical protein
MATSSTRSLRASDRLFTHVVKIHPGVEQEDMICGIGNRSRRVYCLVSFLSEGSYLWKIQVSHGFKLHIKVAQSLLKKLLDQINVGHEHPSTAVSLTAQLVHRFAVLLVKYSSVAECAECISPIRDPFIKKFHVSLPKICNDLDNGQQGNSVRAITISYLATRETAHRNDHLAKCSRGV